MSIPEDWLRQCELYLGWAYTSHAGFKCTFNATCCSGHEPVWGRYGQAPRIFHELQQARVSELVVVRRAKSCDVNHTLLSMSCVSARQQLRDMCKAAGVKQMGNNDEMKLRLIEHNFKLVDKDIQILPFWKSRRVLQLLYPMKCANTCNAFQGAGEEVRFHRSGLLVWRSWLS